MQLAMDPAATTSGIDVGRLTFDPPGERILVTSGGREFITVSEYNAWLGSYPLGITSEDQAIARRQAVEQMVTFKLLAERARVSGYGRDAGTSDKAMVLTYIRDQMSDVSAVTDEQAREYLASHAESMSAIQSTGLPDEIEVAALKGAVLGERLAERIRGWQLAADLGYAQDADPNAHVGGSP